MTRHQVVLIPGDGIGPEVTAAVRRILGAAGAPLEWVEGRAGLAALEQGQDVLPQETLDAITRHQVALKGPCTTPIGEGFTSINVRLRKELDLYAAVRPVRSLDGVPTRYQGVDLVIIRENTEGLYSGIEATLAPGVVTTTKVATEKACTRIARWGFRYARQRGRKKVTVFHKANIMKLTDGMFMRCARAVHDAEFAEIGYQEMIIDAGCMSLVQDPTRFDLLLLENLYGDVLSDLGAGLVGGLGVVPGANIGDAVRGLRGGARLGARHRGPEPRQSARAADVGGDAAELPGRDPRGPGVRGDRAADQGRLQSRARPGPEDARSGRQPRHAAVRGSRRRAAARLSARPGLTIPIYSYI